MRYFPSYNFGFLTLFYQDSNDRFIRLHNLLKIQLIIIDQSDNCFLNVRAAGVSE